MRRFLPLVIASLAIAALFPAKVLAGTQDFTLVNHSGFDIYEIYISETANDVWGEDILEEDVLANGGRVPVVFGDHPACMWDIKVVDREDTEVEWSGINLCEASVVVLTCDDSGECTAQWE